MSLARTINYIRQVGFKRYWRDLNYIGDAKAGRLVGTDRNGNRYYENLEEVPGRHRWVDYHADNEFSASQIDPLWHAWIHHIRKDPPTEDAGLQKMVQPWMTVSCRPSLDSLAPVPNHHSRTPMFACWS
ncbi:hypothetical protein ACQY0O_003301 [Thecaphora frezii]